MPSHQGLWVDYCLFLGKANSMSAECLQDESPAAAGPGRPALLRTAVLVLLAEGASHGYDILTRLPALGVSADPGAVYRMLRSMDCRDELCSQWDSSPHGPARRVYSLTPRGRSRLAEALDQLRAQSRVIAAVLRRDPGPA